MAGKYGIDELKKILVGVADILNVGEEFYRTKKVLTLLKLYDTAMTLIKLNLKEVMSEIGELDADEKTALVSAFAVKLDLKNDEVEKKLESLVILIKDISDSIIEVVAFIKILAPVPPKPVQP